jgi:glutamate racemase
MTARAGLLHTVPALAGTFQAAVLRRVPDAELVHLADPELLATAVRDGVTPAVHERVARHLRYLVDAGADALLVTCSSIGEAVEDAARSLPVPVLRVDAPMAAEAVELAAAAGRAAGRPGRIAVLATLAATLGPTGRLIERSSTDTAADVQVVAMVVEGAIAARDAGDRGTHDRLIQEAVRDADADVIVLAQASMAAAADAGAAAPVLTSPEGGVAALADALARTVAAAAGPAGPAGQVGSTASAMP